MVSMLGEVIEVVMKSMRFWNMIVSALFSLFGGAIILLSQSFPKDVGTGDPGSGFWPISLGSLMIALSILLLIQGLASPNIKEKTLNLMSDANKKVYGVMGLSVLFCVFTYLLGFIVSAFLFVYLAMSLLGVQSRKEKIATSLIINVALYLLFTVALKTFLPLPIFLR